MSDDFLNEMRRNWRPEDDAGDEELERMASTLKRKYAWSRLGFPLELATSAVAVGAGVFLFFTDFGPHTMIARLAAAVLLVAVPILTTVSWFIRRAHPKWESETPEGVLNYALRRLDVVERLVQLAAWHAYILAGFAIALVVFAALGQMRLDAFLIGFVVFYLAVGAGTYAWTRWRRTKLERERERCKALLAEYANGVA
jgi:uncharacterized protein (DUF2062 family)